MGRGPINVQTVPGASGLHCGLSWTSHCTQAPARTQSGLSVCHPGPRPLPGGCSLGAGESHQGVPFSGFWDHPGAFTERQDHRKDVCWWLGMGPSRAWGRGRAAQGLWPWEETPAAPASARLGAWVPTDSGLPGGKQRKAKGQPSGGRTPAGGRPPAGGGLGHLLLVLWSFCCVSGTQNPSDMTAGAYLLRRGQQR